MKFLFVWICIASSSFQCYSQYDLRQIELSEIPKGVQDIGIIAKVVRWTDSLGDNILITTKKEIRHSKEMSPPNATLNRKDGWFTNEAEISSKLTLINPPYTLHYFVKKDSAILTWQVMGIIKKCNDDNFNVVNNWFVITDLDKDNMAESWIIYRSICPQHEGVDTGIIKIVMYENEIKSTITCSLKKESFQEGAMDSNFKSNPDIFKKYAAQLWKRFVTQN